MKPRRYADPAEFLDRVGEFLLSCEAEHNLMLAICTGLLRQEWAEQPAYLAIVERDQEIDLVAVRTPPRNLILSRCDVPGAILALARDLAGKLEPIPGVLGPPEVARRFADAWRDATGGDHWLAMEMGVYRLEEVEPVSGVPGELRAAGQSDRDLLIDWLASFSHEAEFTENRLSAVEAADRFLGADSAARGLYLWQVEGVPASLVGFSGATPNGSRIGPVYTPPEHRRRGYASASVAALSRRLLESGRRYCYLYTDLANTTSNHIYQEIGFRHVADALQFRFGTRP